MAAATRTDDEAAQIAPPRFGDEPLDEKVRAEVAERVDDAFGRLAVFRKDDAEALRAFKELDHDRGGADELEEIVGVVRNVGHAGRGHGNPRVAQALEGEEFVAGAEERVAVVETGHAGGFELTDHGRAVEGDRNPDAGDDTVDRSERAAAVMDLACRGTDPHVAAQGIEDANAMPAFAPRLDEAAGRVETRIAGEEDEAHGRRGWDGGW
jgi:hypothetical protein